MSQITLAQMKFNGSVAETFTTDDHVYCTASDDVEVGYEIVPEESLGSGGNGIVYGCRSIETGEAFAIKIQVDTRQNRLNRFIREKRLLLSLHHDQLMRCLGCGEVKLARKRYGIENHPFVIMPQADANLVDLVKREANTLSFDKIAGQFRGLSEALAVLHEHAIHRDIKPENILVRGETWILSDFGLCKILDPMENGADVTLDGEIVGPKFWMSPESMNRVLGCGDEISKASDVFQLAAVFWFAATRRHPTGIVRANDWEGPSDIFKVLESALSHDPQSRPQDGREFHERIERALF